MIDELKKHIINENTIQKQIAEGEGIEFSYTGELVPLEIVETEFNNFIESLGEDFKWNLILGRYSKIIMSIIKKKASIESMNIVPGAKRR